MQTDDFFHGTEHVDWPDIRPGEWVSQLRELDVELMESLRFGPLPAHTDLDVAVALTRLLQEDFVSRGTIHDERMNDEEVVLAVKAHRAVLERLGLEPPQLPFRHHSGFFDYWRKNGMSGGGGWQARRECIEELLGPTRQALEDLQEAEEPEAAETLYRRLYRSLGSLPEQTVLRTYCTRYAEPDGFDLPALIPQVYLHYDPYTRKAADTAVLCTASAWTSCCWPPTAPAS